MKTDSMTHGDADCGHASLDGDDEAGVFHKRVYCKNRFDLHSFPFDLT